MEWFEIIVYTLIGVNVIGCFLTFLKLQRLKKKSINNNDLYGKEFFITNEFLINGIFLIEVSYCFANYNWVSQNMSQRLGGVYPPLIYIYVISECLRNIFFILIICFALYKINLLESSLNKGITNGKTGV